MPNSSTGNNDIDNDSNNDVDGIDIDIDIDEIYESYSDTSIERISRDQVILCLRVKMFLSQYRRYYRN